MTDFNTNNFPKIDFLILPTTDSKETFDFYYKIFSELGFIFRNKGSDWIQFIDQSGISLSFKELFPVQKNKSALWCITLHTNSLDKLMACYDICLANDKVKINFGNAENFDEIIKKFKKFSFRCPSNGLITIGVMP